MKNESKNTDVTFTSNTTFLRTLISSFARYYYRLSDAFSVLKVSNDHGNR